MDAPQKDEVGTCYHVPILMGLVGRRAEQARSPENQQ